MTEFAMTIVPGQGRHMRGSVVTCRCGVAKTVAVNQFSNSTPRDQHDLEQQLIRRKLEEAGWLVGKRPGKHLCPGCAAKNKETNVVPITKPDAPREMGREDRRIIFEKLNEVYVNETTGYGPGWTDAKVATDLGVPRAWVTMVRDEMFGPEGSNEEIRATIKDATALLAEIKALLPQLGAVTHKADVIEKRLAEIQKDLR